VSTLLAVNTGAPPARGAIDSATVVVLSVGMTEPPDPGNPVSASAVNVP
jgi:hypothetical protein